jgi:hypothetical protein
MAALSSRSIVRYLLYSLVGVVVRCMGLWAFAKLDGSLSVLSVVTHKHASCKHTSMAATNVMVLALFIQSRLLD